MTRSQDRCGDGFERVDARGEHAGGVEGAEVGDRLIEGAGGAKQRQIGFGADPREGARILGVEFVAQLLDVGVDRQRSVREQVDDVGQSEVDGDGADARGFERIDRDGDDLARRGDAIAADQLGADLQHLARRAELARAQFHHLPGVAKAQRARRLGEQRGGDAADLPRDVGAQRERAPRHRIGEAEQVARRALVLAAERLAELGERRRDAAIAMRAHRIDERAGDARRGLRLSGGDHAALRAAGQGPWSCVRP